MTRIGRAQNPRVRRIFLEGGTGRIPARNRQPSSASRSRHVEQVTPEDNAKPTRGLTHDTGCVLEFGLVVRGSQHHDQSFGA